MNIGDLKATLGVDTKGLDAAEQRLKQFTNIANNLLSKIGGTGTGKLGTNLNQMANDTQKALNTIGKSVGATGKQLTLFAQTTSSGMSQAKVNLASFGNAALKVFGDVQKGAGSLKETTKQLNLFEYASARALTPKNAKLMADLNAKMAKGGDVAAGLAQKYGVAGASIAASVKQFETQGVVLQKSAGLNAHYAKLLDDFRTKQDAANASLSKGSTLLPKYQSYLADLNDKMSKSIPLSTTLSEKMGGLGNAVAYLDKLRGSKAVLTDVQSAMAGTVKEFGKGAQQLSLFNNTVAKTSGTLSVFDRLSQVGTKISSSFGTAFGNVSAKLNELGVKGPYQLNLLSLGAQRAAGNLKPLAQVASTASAGVKDIGAAAAGIAVPLQTTANNMGKAAKGAASLGAFAGILGAQSTKAAGYIADLSKEAGKVGGTVNNAGKTYRNFGTALSSSTNAVNTQAKSMKNLGDIASRSVSQGERSTKSWIMGVAAGMLVYRGIMLIMNSITGAISGTFRAAVDFEKQFAMVRKVFEATEPEMQKLSDGFRNMALVVPLPLEEILKIGRAAGQLGIEKENVVAFTKVVADLAATTDNLNADEAAMALARFANITRLSTDDFAKLGSTILYLGNNAATTEKDLINMAMRVAAAGTQIGLTQGEILAFSSTMSSVGIRAEMGGSAISRVFLDIDLAVATSNKKLQKFADVAAIGFKKASMSAEEFRESFRRAPAETLQAFFQGLGAINSKAGALTVTLQDLNIKNQRMRDTVTRLALASALLIESLKLQSWGWTHETYLAARAAIQYETAAGRLQLFRNAVYNLAIDIGGKFVPGLMNIVVKIKGLTIALEKGEISLKAITGALVTFFAVLAIGKFVAFVGAVEAGAAGLGLFARAVGNIRVIMGALLAGEFALAGRVLKDIGTGATVAAGGMTALQSAILAAGVAWVAIKIAEWIDSLDLFGQKATVAAAAVLHQAVIYRDVAEKIGAFSGAMSKYQKLLDAGTISQNTFNGILLDMKQQRFGETYEQYRDRLKSLIDMFVKAHPEAKKLADEMLNLANVKPIPLSDVDTKIMEELEERANAATKLAEKMERAKVLGGSAVEIVSAWGEELVQLVERQTKYNDVLDDTTKKWLNISKGMIAGAVGRSPELMAWIESVRDLKLPGNFLYDLNKIDIAGQNAVKTYGNLMAVVSDIKAPESLRDWASETARHVEQEIQGRAEVLAILDRTADSIARITNLDDVGLAILGLTGAQRKRILAQLKEQNVLAAKAIEYYKESDVILADVFQSACNSLSSLLTGKEAEQALKEYDDMVEGYKNYADLQESISKEVTKDLLDELRIREQMLGTIVPMTEAEEQLMEVEKIHLQFAINAEEIRIKYLQRRAELEKDINEKTLFPYQRAELLQKLTELYPAMMRELEQLGTLEVASVIKFHKEQYLEMINTVRENAGEVFDAMIAGGKASFTKLLDWIKAVFLSQLRKMFQNAMAGLFTPVEGQSFLSGLFEGVLPKSLNMTAGATNEGVNKIITAIEKSTVEEGAAALSYQALQKSYKAIEPTSYYAGVSGGSFSSGFNPQQMNWAGISPSVLAGSYGTVGGVYEGVAGAGGGYGGGYTGAGVSTNDYYSWVTDHLQLGGPAQPVTMIGGTRLEDFVGPIQQQVKTNAIWTSLFGPGGQGMTLSNFFGGGEGGFFGTKGQPGFLGSGTGGIGGRGVGGAVGGMMSGAGLSLMMSGYQGKGTGSWAKAIGGGATAGFSMGGPWGAAIGAIVGLSSKLNQAAYEGNKWAKIYAFLETGGLSLLFGKSSSVAGQMEVKRDLGGVELERGQFKKFYEDLNLTEGTAYHIRKDLYMSPKFLSEIAGPLAKSQGRMNEFLKSLENVKTSWGTFNFRKAYEIGSATGDWTQLNEEFVAAFKNSEKLKEMLPDWESVLTTEGYQTEVEKLTESLTNFRDAIKSSMSSSVSMYDTFVESGKITDELRAKIIGLGGDITKFEELSALMTSSMEQIAENDATIESLNSLSDSIKNLGKSTDDMYQTFISTGDITDEFRAKIIALDGDITAFESYGQMIKDAMALVAANDALISSLTNLQNAISELTTPITDLTTVYMETGEVTGELRKQIIALDGDLAAFEAFGKLIQSSKAEIDANNAVISSLTDLQNAVKELTIPITDLTSVYMETGEVTGGLREQITALGGDLAAFEAFGKLIQSSKAEIDVNNAVIDSLTSLRDSLTKTSATMYDTFLEAGVITEEFRTQILALGGTLSRFEDYARLTQINTGFESMVATFRETGEVLPGLRQMFIDFGGDLSALDNLGNLPKLKSSLGIISDLMSRLQADLPDPIEDLLAGRMDTTVINALTGVGLDPSKFRPLVEMINVMKDWQSQSFQPFQELTSGLMGYLQEYGGVAGQTAVSRYGKGFNTITQGLLDTTFLGIQRKYQEEVKKALDYLGIIQQSTADQIANLTTTVETQFTTIGSNITAAINNSAIWLAPELTKMIAGLSEANNQIRATLSADGTGIIGEIGLMIGTVETLNTNITTKLSKDGQVIFDELVLMKGKLETLNTNIMDKLSTDGTTIRDKIGDMITELQTQTTLITDALDLVKQGVVDAINGVITTAVTGGGGVGGVPPETVTHQTSEEYQAEVQRIFAEYGYDYGNQWLMQNPYPQYLHGGVVEKTGPVWAHAGEVFSGINNEMGFGQGPTVIINGDIYGIDDLDNKLKKAFGRLNRKGYAIA